MSIMCKLHTHGAYRLATRVQYWERATSATQAAYRQTAQNWNSRYETQELRIFCTAAIHFTHLKGNRNSFLPAMKRESMVSAKGSWNHQDKAGDYL